MRRKRSIRWLVFIVLASLGPMAVLYVSNPIVAQRYYDLFTPEDGRFESLQPREAVAGSAAYELPVAAFGNRTVSQDALDAMEAYAAEQNSWGLVVVQNGEVQKEWYADDWDRDRLTQSQSMQKSVLPVLIQAAIEDGYIGAFADPVGKYIEEWRDDPRGEITIEQMLWMSSGLLDYPFSLNPWSDAFLWLFGTDITPTLLATPLDWVPGTKFVYNNINSELLGLLLERATGQRYADYLSARLWQPMGGVGGELWLDSEGGKAHSSCCLLAPAMDWAKFGVLLLERGEINGQRIVSADFIDRMVTASPTLDWYGMQIWLGYSRELNPRAKLLAGGYQRTEPFLAEDTYYASGFGAQRVYVVPSAELVIVRMGPASGRAPVKETWDNTYLVNTALRNQVVR
ncbi:beta-lactamase family protein [Gammaproteobacteria bacterium]|nr:beta-lactamase family protein [Gammaproteobacteria bacterium]